MAKELSLALSGSGFKFPVHVGVLKAAEEREKRIVEIAGTSGGAMIGGLYACGMSSYALHNWSVNTKWVRYFSPSFHAIRHGGLMDLKRFTENLKDFTHGKRFKDIGTGIDLKIVATDIATHTPVVFSRETTPDFPVYLAIRASIAIPVVFSPVRVDGMILTDGAIFNYLPINLLHNEDAKRIGMKVTYPDTVQGIRKLWPIELGIQAAYAIVDRSQHWALEHFAEQKGIHIAKMQTGFVNGMDPFISLEKREKLVEVGRQSLLKHL